MKMMRITFVELMFDDMKHKFSLFYRGYNQIKEQFLYWNQYAVKIH